MLRDRYEPMDLFAQIPRLGMQMDPVLAQLDRLLDTDLARQLKVTEGRTLRIDGTVVETHIHHPSDSTLLNDGVRVITRVLRRIQTVAQDAVDARAAQMHEMAAAAKAGMKRIMDVAARRASRLPMR